jgi:uncharacterized damage-inducible protein DinB
MSDILRQQYDLVKDMRSVLLNWCAAMEPDHFVTPVPGFQDKSMRDLLVHITHAYTFWIGHFALQKKYPYVREKELPSVASVAALYHDVDTMMNNFLNRYQHNTAERVVDEVRKKSSTLSALQLFTHAVTHEFHHKGQILTMGRYHGYTPVDTDIIRL